MDNIKKRFVFLNYNAQVQITELENDDLHKKWKKNHENLVNCILKSIL